MNERSVTSNVVGLGRLLQIEWEARQAESMDDIAFLSVNETRQLINYDRALLWLPWQRRVRAVSGVSAIDRTAPFSQWANKLARHLARRAPQQDFYPVVADDLPAGLRAGLSEWSPGALLWLPLRIDDAPRNGGLLLMRPEPFEDSEIQILVRLSNAYAHALSLLRLRRAGRIARKGRNLFGRLWLPALALAALAALFIPVRLTLLVPAEVVPASPFVVSTPIDGVVSEFLVDPNEPVKQQQVVVRLEDAELRARLDVADKALASVAAELSRARQRAFTDLRSKADLPVLQAKLAEKQADRDYTASRLEWANIRAPEDGIAIFNDPNYWTGRPVSVGERILTVADPRDVRLDVWIPASDAVDLPANAEVLFFRNASPDAPVAARLEIVSYEGQARPDGTVAHRGKAVFAGTEATPRLGLTGTAKIHGEQVTLMYLIARRPLAALRRWFGL